MPRSKGSQDRPLGRAGPQAGAHVSSAIGRHGRRGSKLWKGADHAELWLVCLSRCPRFRDCCGKTRMLRDARTKPFLRSTRRESAKTDDWEAWKDSLSAGTRRLDETTSYWTTRTNQQKGHALLSTHLNLLPSAGGRFSAEQEGLLSKAATNGRLFPDYTSRYGT